MYTTRYANCDLKDIPDALCELVQPLFVPAISSGGRSHTLVDFIFASRMKMEAKCDKSPGVTVSCPYASLP